MTSILARLFNARIGQISQKLDNYYGHCLHCGTTWAFVQPHKLQHNDYAYTQALCEKCHGELSIDERLRYYRQDWERGNLGWQEHCLMHWGRIIGDGTGWTIWSQVEKAVKANK